MSGKTVETECFVFIFVEFTRISIQMSQHQLFFYDFDGQNDDFGSAKQFIYYFYPSPLQKL